MGSGTGKGDMPDCVSMGMNAITNSGREVKFLGYMRLQKLKDTILPPERAEINNDNKKYFRLWPI